MARKDNNLKVNDRVVTNVDLNGIPAGTPGRVILVNGIADRRYRVWFDVGGPNGTDVGHIPASALTRVDRKGNPK